MPGVDDPDLWDYNDNLASRVDKPDICFRMTVDHGLKRNYLDAYTVTLAPQGADVAWGGIAWKAWKDLTCGSMDFVAMEQVDVCAMFADEVDALPTPKAIAVAQAAAGADSDASDNVTEPTLAGFNLSFKDAAANRHQFTDMWYVREKEMPPPNLYPGNMVRGVPPAATDTTQSREEVWVPTLDDDYDPIYGDLGKVSTMGGDNAENFAMDDDSYKCTADDGGSAATGEKGKDVNSTLCDASDVEIATSVTFPLGLGYGLRSNQGGVHPHLRLEFPW